MAPTIATLLVGLVAVISVSGVGRLFLRPAEPLAAHWYVALSLIAGQSASSLLVQLAAMAGTAVVPLQACAAGIVMAGLAGHLLARRSWTSSPRPRRGPVLTVAAVLISASFLLLILISLAPSSKIDELHYHMLVGRRIVEDHGLLIYQLPFEQAIVPQMGFQIFEALFHLFHTMDAGNVVSLAFFGALIFLLYGVVAEESGSTDAGLIAAAAASVGVFPAVWDVTAGPHALGDLGTFTAVAALMFPGSMAGGGDNADARAAAWPYRRTLACMLGAACAASTKISLVPLAVTITALATFGVPKNRRIKVALVALAIWSVILGPLIVWTYVHTNSPFGAAFAEWFPKSTYQRVVLDRLFATRADSQLQNPFPYIGQALNGLGIGLMQYGAIACVRRPRKYGVLAGLLALQIALILWLLPYDFRFLGGLQYGFLAVGAVSLAATWPARPTMRSVAGGALLLIGPWLAAETLFAWPFAQVSLGFVSQSTFKDRYIAFNQDFEALDLRLPRDAVLYAPDERPPAVYAPRRMIFDLADWDGHSPVFKFKVGDEPEAPGYLARQRALGLDCTQVIYSNAAAVAVAYRTPGHAPQLERLLVRKCTRG